MTVDEINPGARSWVRASGALLLGLALVATGCRSRYADFCEAKVQCEGGNDADVEACEIIKESNEDIAAVYACEAQWEAVAACVQDSSHCDFSGHVKRYAENWELCADVIGRWERCQDHDTSSW